MLLAHRWTRPRTVLDVLRRICSLINRLAIDALAPPPDDAQPGTIIPPPGDGSGLARAVGIGLFSLSPAALAAAEVCVDFAAPDAAVRVHAEVARSDAERQRGLMYRDTVPDGHGMLFVYERPQILRFWMRNTRVPLDVAFIDDTPAVAGITAMQPYDETIHDGPAPTRWALEVRQGWYAEHGIGIGTPATVGPCQAPHRHP